MKCPVCSKQMLQKDFGGVAVDVCAEGCKGIWFDWFELSKLDERNEGEGQALQEALKNSRVNDASRSPIRCPKCGLPLHAHKYPSDKEMNVDECYQCGGFFLDSGELKVIREHSMTPEEEERYCQKLMDENPLFAQAKKDLEKEKIRNEAIRRYTRFIRLSYYMTGR